MVEGAQAASDALLMFSDMIGGVEGKMNVFLGRHDGFKGSMEGAGSIETKNPDDFFDWAVNALIDNAKILDEATKDLIRGFDGSSLHPRH